MKNLILIIMILTLSVSLHAFEELKSLAQLKEHNLIFLKFDKDGCPWCLRYESELEDRILIKYTKDIKFFKVKKGSEIFSQFRKALGYKILIYPMTYILRLNSNKESEVVEEIYGYQTEEYIEELFQNILLIK